jgi:hypothetical protein
LIQPYVLGGYGPRPAKNSGGKDPQYTRNAHLHDDAARWLAGLLQLELSNEGTDDTDDIMAMVQCTPASMVPCLYSMMTHSLSQ